MKKNAVKESKSIQAAELRRRAEEHLRSNEDDRVEVRSVADARALVHELQVHQIELEIQNEELRRARTEAGEAKEKYLDLFDFAPAGHFLWDREGRIVEINLAGAALLGLERRAARGMRFGQFVAARFRGVFAEFLMRVLTTDAKQTCEVVMEREGAPVWVLVEGIAAQDRKGPERLCRATVIDISAQKRADELAAANQALETEMLVRKKAEEEVRASEKKYRSLFDNMTEGFGLHEIILDADGKPCDWRFLELNAGWEQQTGIPRTTVIGKTMREVWPDLDACWPEKFGKVALSGESMRCEGYNTHLQRWYELFAYSTKPRHFALLFVDITERKRAQDELRKSEERYRDLVEGAVDGIFMADCEGRYLDVNPAGCAMLGMTREEVLRSTFTDVLAPEEHPRLPEAIASLSDGKVHLSEWRFRRKDGSVFVGELAGRQLPDGRLQGIVRDATDRKRAERLGLLENVFQEAPSFLHVLRGPDFVFEFANEAYYRLVGRRELIGRPAFEAMPEAAAGGYPERIARVMATKEPFFGRELPVTLARTAGAAVEERLLDLVYLPLIEPDGTCVRVLGHGTDVTDLVQARKRAEEVVRQKAEELRAVLDTAPVAIWMAQDPECRVITGNAYADELIMGTARGANISRNAPPSEAAITYRVFRDGVELGPAELPAQTATATGKPVPAFEMELLFPNGRKLNLLAGAVPLFGTQGNVRGAVVAGLDVTASRKIQEELARAEERARLALQAGRMGAWDRLMPDGPTVWNEDHYRILGYDSTQVTPSKEAWEARVHPEDLDAFYERVSGALNHGGDFDEELRIVWPGGEVRWVEMRGSIKCDANGQAKRSCGVVLDFTERKRAEEALRISQERLNQAVAVAGLGTFEHDHVTGAIEYSPVLRELMGFAPGETVTMTAIIEKVAPEDREAVAEAVRRAHDPAGEGKYGVDHRVRKADGRVRWISVRSQTFFEGEGSGRRAVRTIGAGLDITEQKEFQAELQRLVDERTARLQELVGELEHFSYTITHDLKSPLRAMRGFAEMMSVTCEGCDRTQEREFLGRISTAADRMDRLIADALNYSRAVRQELPLEDVDAGALLRGMLDSYPEFQADKARIVVDGELPVVLANQAGLTQVFSNLLGNAVKFVKAGEVPEIRVWAEPRASSQLSTPNSQPPQWVRIWVEDKGIGISNEMLPRVFDMFARGSKNYEGTGIGLALVRKVAQRMGGKVGVETEEGRGSRFWIELKCGEAKISFSGPTARRGQKEESGTVLYVEDEESDAMFMQRAFDGNGLAGKLQVVGDGRAAIEYLSGAGQFGDRGKYPIPSLVLLDLNLPQVGGFEVLRWMRNNPDYARLPVVIFSSSTREDDRVMSKELGADEFVAKPSSGMEFGNVVEGLQGKWLGGRSGKRG